MRVTLTQLRQNGRRLNAGARTTMVGELMTTKYLNGSKEVKVLEFLEVRSAPGMFTLSEAKVKECWQEKSIIVFSGLARENDAWVSQEWLIDVAPSQEMIARSTVRSHMPTSLPPAHKPRQE
ncbi:hypothetical protein [Hydrogenophaga sp.]|uniref:hypothetical protein n=1 Tax=Hydrogenophaga sp. TaxID=1904254 RepID=UPI003F70D493